MINFNSVSLKSAFSELNFTFDSGVLCVVTDREKSDDAFFSLITGEIFPDNGYVQADKKNISFCSTALPNEVKVKDYLKFILKHKKCPVLPDLSQQLTNHVLENYIGTLTEFEKIKLSVAGALIGEPNLILLNAPAKKLEPSEVKKLGALIDELREHASIIYSCNVPSLFGEHSDKLLVIAESKMLGFSETAEIFALSKKEGGLLAKIKGDIDGAAGFLSPDTYTLEKSEKNGIFTVRCTDSEQARKELRSVVRRLGTALLSMKADNDTLKEMFASLSRIEEENTELEELDQEDERAFDEDIFNNSEELEKTYSIEAKNHENAYDSLASEEEKVSGTASEPRRKLKIPIAFAHNDEEDEE